MIQIIPAILATTPEKYQQDIEKLNSAESLKEGWVHIDFMDNKFVPNQSIEPEVTEKYPTHLNKEAHIMVEHPLEWISKLKELNFKRVVFHFESKDSPQKVIDAIKNEGMEAGIAVNPQSLIQPLKQLKNLDLILVMGVEPGFQGRPFEENTYERLTEVSSFFDNAAVDGGVKDQNALKLVQSGAKTLISGSFILNGMIDEQIEKIWEAVKG